MVSISLIIAGFMLLIAAELRFLRRHAKISIKSHRLLQTLGYAFIALGFALSFLHDGNSLRLPELLRVLLLAAAIIGCILLIWTTFLEIPIGTVKFQVAPGKPYSFGSYGRCRHPGYWWFLLFSASLAFFEGNALAFANLFASNLLNLLLIFLQDKYTFPVQFENYLEYAAKVPFLIPKLPHLRKQ